MISPAVLRVVPHRVCLIKESTFCIPRVFQPSAVGTAGCGSAEGTAVSWGTKGSPSVQPHISSTQLWAQCPQCRMAMSCSGVLPAAGKVAGIVLPSKSWASRMLLLGLEQHCIGGWTAHHLGWDQLLLQCHFPFPLSFLWFPGSQ